MKPRLVRNFLQLTEAGKVKLDRSLKENYFTRNIFGESNLSSEAYLGSAEGKNDLVDHLHGRIDQFRRLIIPWIDSVIPLAGRNILEIGCGTGSSTVALLEQGANVTAIDIDAASVAVARERCMVYGVTGVIEEANATSAHKMFKNKAFDLIIFFAAVEHMTHEERIEAMKSTWTMLPKGSLWCILDTPNRLWYFDGHTAQLPFFHWLPDKFAFEYSQFSESPTFNKSFRNFTEESMLNFLRRGRGVSFHEFHVAMKKVQDLKIISCLHDRNRFRNIARSLMRSKNYRFEQFLIDVGPKIHHGFYKQSLDIIIRKD